MSPDALKLDLHELSQVFMSVIASAIDAEDARGAPRTAENLLHAFATYP